MGILASLHDLLFAPHTGEATPTAEPRQHRWGLRDALLRCSTLTKEDVDAYIAYEFEGIVYEDVPFDYELDHPDAETERLYSDGVLQVKILRRHTNQIEPETLAKVRRVLPLLYHR